jgi:hypothetical protein
MDQESRFDLSWYNLPSNMAPCHASLATMVSRNSARWLRAVYRLQDRLNPRQHRYSAERSFALFSRVFMIGEAGCTFTHHRLDLYAFQSL